MKRGLGEICSAMELLGPEMKLVQGGTSGHGKVFADIILTVPFNISSYVIAKHKLKKIAVNKSTWATLYMDTRMLQLASKLRQK